MTALHLVADITAHGFGHLAQSACVLNALARERSDIRVTVRCGHDRHILEQFLEFSFETSSPSPDPGMHNLGPSRVDAEKSLLAYQELIADWNGLLKHEADKLSHLKPDLLYSNIGFVGPAAAQLIKLPAIGLCSLNWMDVFSAYCADMPGGRDVLSVMQDSYAGLGLFLQPTPSMEMTKFCPQKKVAPISRLRERLQPAKLQKIRDRSGSRRVVMATLGGIRRDTSWDILPQIDGVSWITPNDAPPDREDVIDCASLELDYFDALCASELTITKTGYGTLVEAACNGIRLLYAARPDWPESSALEGWVAQNALSRPCTQEELYKGNFAEIVVDMLNSPPLPPVRAGGGGEAASILIDVLENSQFPIA